MTAKVAIVTDSAACLSPSMAAEYRIQVVPIHIVFGDKAYRDGIDLSAEQFYRELRHVEKLPTTAAPPPADFLSAYEQAGRIASTVLCITLTSRFSGVYNVCLVAKDMAKEKLPGLNIEVLDCQTAVAAQALVVLEAARAAQTGQNLVEVKQAAQKVMDRVFLYSMLDTMQYMARQGRVPKISAMAASLLRIKPILATEKNGNTYPVSRPRTTKAALEELLVIMKQKSHGRPLHVATMHAAAPERAAWLKSEIEKRFNCREIISTEYSPVIGAHTGPGLAGYAFYEED
jgi:DegV family protein with EDD domain